MAMKFVKLSNADASLSDVYIIMLTAKGQESDRDKDIGADIYTMKPFNPDEILENPVKS